jgi:hypothetical protein
MDPKFYIRSNYLVEQHVYYELHLKIGEARTLPISSKSLTERYMDTKMHC